MTKRATDTIGQTLKRQAAVLGSFILVFWLLEALDWLLLGGTLDQFGILPRTWIGLRGVLFGPFLHVGFRHVAANTMPFLVLGWFVLLRGGRMFAVVTVVTAVTSGLGIWLTGPARTVHLGASGLVFGYFGFLVFRGYFERSFSAIIWALLVIFLYGGMIWGVLPQQFGISWQAHLFGFFGGGLAAFLLSTRRTAVSELAEADEWSYPFDDS